MRSSDVTDTRLRVRSLTVVHGPALVPALDAVELQVAAGEIVSILGPSGGGKSTLLRSIAGLVPVVAGSIELDGVDISAVPAHRRGVALMFQDYALFPHLDVADNVGYGLRMRSIGRTERRRRVSELLDLVRLGDFGTRSVSTLSGGERQRVALARALATGPKLLMLDEPLSALDRSLRQSLVSELHGLFRDEGLSVMHVTHDQDEAFAIADRILVLRDGRIEHSGSPSTIWDDPGSESLARFLGHRTVVAASVLRQLVQPVDLGDAGDDARILVLDSAVEIEPVRGSERGSERGDATVVRSRFTSGHQEITCRLHDSTLEIIAPVATERASSFPVGASVTMIIDPSGVRVLAR